MAPGRVLQTPQLESVGEDVSGSVWSVTGATPMQKAVTGLTLPFSPLLNFRALRRDAHPVYTTSPSQ